MKKTDGLFLACAREVFAGQRHRLRRADHRRRLHEARAGPLGVRRAAVENLYGDVVSDLCAGLVGGLGVVPGANIGDEAAVFEAVHGSAPDIAGQDVANPLALLMSAVMMLNHLAERERDPRYREAGTRIRGAYDAALRAGEKTRDVGGTLGTRAFADAIIARVRQSSSFVDSNEANSDRETSAASMRDHGRLERFALQARELLAFGIPGTPFTLGKLIVLAVLAGAAVLLQPARHALGRRFAAGAPPPGHRRADRRGHAGALCGRDGRGDRDPRGRRHRPECVRGARGRSGRGSRLRAPERHEQLRQRADHPDRAPDQSRRPGRYGRASVERSAGSEPGPRRS